MPNNESRTDKLDKVWKYLAESVKSKIFIVYFILSAVTLVEIADKYSMLK